MLILSRKPGQGITIYTESGEQITVQVCRVEGSQVKVGVEAPASVRVVREELQTDCFEKLKV